MRISKQSSRPKYRDYNIYGNIIFYQFEKQKLLLNHFFTSYGCISRPFTIRYYHFNINPLTDMLKISFSEISMPF